MNMNHLSLFTGIGGLDLAAEWAGFHTVGQVEIDDYCNKVLQKHWPDVPRWRDVYDLTGEEIKEKCGSISLLSGGFPCQPFSCAGKRRGTEDERYLWDELLRIICEVRPKWFVGENVRGLLSIDAGRTFGRILSDLAENGYRVGWLCYGAGDVGAPHRRERVFILAHSGCELQQGAEFRRKDEVEIGRQVADKYQRSSKARGNDMAYTEGGQPGQQEVGNGWQDISRGSEEMANADNPRSGTPRNGIDGNGQTENKGRAEQSFGGVSRQGEMANTDKQGMERCENAGEVGRKGQERNEQPGRQREGKTDRPTEPSMGRVPSRFPAGMDGGYWPTPTSRDYKGADYSENSKRFSRATELNTQVQLWPAGPGEQHEWEPPRIATGIKDRVARLKCLGNAVVPQQAYPIFKAISQIEGVQ